MPNDPISPSSPNWAISLIQGTTAVPTSLAKLLDTIGVQIGLVSEPFHIRRKGQAELDMQVASARAEGEVAVIRRENQFILDNIEDRVNERVRYKEIKRQKNLEDIAAKAAQEIPEFVSEVPVDEDWVFEFINKSQDVSNEQLQSLWARLLAGEVVKPGSFSLRTLAFVRTMSKEDADLFTRFCSMLWTINEDDKILAAYLLPSENLEATSDFGMQFTDFVRLDTLGLIRYESFSPVSLQFSLNDNYSATSGFNVVKLTWKYFGRSHTLTKKMDVASQVESVVMGNAMISDLGRELASISGAMPNETYRQLVIKQLIQAGWEVDEG
jgi:uncharacterized repeat protein (TIGR03899 family)